ncbi:hypothetical protein KY284_007838 [Solanum tuberosum]|nr:hypothetical protein KY284_007838 [Solanum tuberosum]
MNLNQDLPDIQMVDSAPHILHNWWKIIRRIHEAEIRGYLGTLLSLLGTQCNTVFVTHSLTELPIRGRLLMIPSAICTGDFLRLFDLHIFRSLRYVEDIHVELDYLFQRFGHSEGYYEYQHEFECTRGAWEHMRPRVFVMAFLGVMVFPIRSNSVDINILPMWEYTINLEIGEKKWCTPEYYAWWNTKKTRKRILKKIRKRTLKKTQKRDPEEDPKEEVEEDHIEVSKTGSDIYDSRDGGVIDMSPERGPDESPEYHLG